jgi:hypothetical protein
MSFTDPTQHPIATLLPRFIFLTGPNGVGKTTHARQLFDEVKGLQHFSFAEPLREGVRGLFWQGDITVDLVHETVKSSPLPGFLDKTHREALNSLGDWFRSFLGEYALGRLALARCTMDGEYFEHFVFDDARRLTDILPIVSAFGKESCLLLNMTRLGVGFDQPNPFLHDEGIFEACYTRTFINNGTVEEMLPRLHTLLSSSPIPSQPEESTDGPAPV